MKKPLLLFGALALTAASAMADVHTLVFTGTDDMYGLTRQTTATSTALSYVKEWSFTEAGINFKIEDTKTAASSKGFALVYAPDAKSWPGEGIYCYGNFTAANQTAPAITLTVPGGKITSVKMLLGGYALSSLTPEMNGTSTEGTSSDNKNFTYSWANATGVETMTITWPGTYYPRYVQTIEVTYTQDLGGKQESGLAFSDTEAEGVVGEAFTAPTLTNPNNLPITWSSSDETVATVNASGAVTLLAGGTTTITAATVGNDSYAAGNAKYTLTVIPQATTIAQMQAVAPVAGDRVKVNCPLTVTYASTNFAYVIDAANNATRVENVKNAGSTSTSSTQIYQKGQVIPAGWMATNATAYDDEWWQGIPADPTETVEVTYPEVENVTRADANRVLVLKYVTFANKTPYAEGTAWASTPLGSVEVQNLYNAPEMPAGTYDVTCVVRYYKRNTTDKLYICPIEYVEVVDEGPEFPAELDVTCDETGVTIEQGIDEDTDAIMLTVSGKSIQDNATLTFNLPEGWEGVASVEMTAMMMAASRATAEWPTLDEFAAEYEGYGLGVTSGTTVTIPADGEYHILHCALYTTDHLVDVEHPIQVVANITKKDTGIDNIAVENGPARYYNMQGIEVANPANGAFIMVQNGKATKISK